MARREYPFRLNNNLDKYLRIKQAKMSIKTGKNITLNELYKDMATYMDVSVNTVALIKAKNYNPSLIVALAMAKYLDAKVDDLFSIEEAK